MIRINDKRRIRVELVVPASWIEGTGTPATAWAAVLAHIGLSRSPLDFDTESTSYNPGVSTLAELRDQIIESQDNFYYGNIRDNTSNQIFSMYIPSGTRVYVQAKQIVEGANTVIDVIPLNGATEYFGMLMNSIKVYQLTRVKASVNPITKSTEPDIDKLSNDA